MDGEEFHAGGLGMYYGEGMISKVREYTHTCLLFGRRHTYSL